MIACSPSGNQMTVGALGQVLSRDPAYRHLEPVFDEGAGTLIKPLSWQGDLSLGPRRDGRRTVQSLDGNPRWAGIPDLDEAGPRAITAYFRTYGPATLDNLHYWLGDGLSAGRKRLESWFAGLGDRIVAVDVEGTVAYAASEDVDALESAGSSEAVRFLPGHDQWVMGPGTKDTHVTPSARRDVMTRKANPVIRAGVVCGTWARKGDALTVTWLDVSAPPTEAIEQEADRLATILDEDLRLTIAP